LAGSPGWVWTKTWPLFMARVFARCMYQVVARASTITIATIPNILFIDFRLLHCPRQWPDRREKFSGSMQIREPCLIPG
jgi:hypothetical protein